VSNVPLGIVEAAIGEINQVKAILGKKDVGGLIVYVAQAFIVV